MDQRDAARAVSLATKVAGRGLMLKFGVAGAGIFFVLLLVFGLVAGGMSGSAAAAAQSCGDLGTPSAPLPGGGGSTPSGPLHDQELANAKVIDQAAQQGGLSGRATLIGLMTALQESSLIDLPNGDRDSIGLFQQRPSAGWGTVDQILHHPDFQAHSFFYGVGPQHDPHGLTQIVAWQTMSLGGAAQAVQGSAYPLLYAGQEAPARQIAQQAGINLDRPGTGDGNGHVPDSSGSPTPTNSTGGNCYSSTPPGQTGGPFHDGSSPWPDVVKNPRSTEQAIQWERDQAATGEATWHLRCLATVASAYGWGGAGYTNPPANSHSYATELYRNLIPASMHHDGDRNPPPGALMFWDTGSLAGHVAMYIGNGQVASSDILRPGYIDIVPATEIETKWGAKYIGWAPPYFPAAG
ncbi:peptidase M23 [Kitasatospora sp. NPDC059973]|uniref:peptidase M23 n=1 Tax=Kitasatospora sp. NPDC059973 TaxID=3347020 RepID=UPI0036B535F2